jgi:ATP-dependent Lhr-like helicase
LSSPQNPKARAFAPLRTSPVALYQRENLDDWLHLAQTNSGAELASDTQTVLDALKRGGALFFSEIVRRTGLLPSQVEEALSQLAALGFVTSDSFDGLRALLVPSDKRPTFGRNEGKRRRKTNLASIEFAGRWSLLRMQSSSGSQTADDGALPNSSSRDAAVEKFARVLLRRYGIVFRRLLERESFAATWYELGRIYRRWEARGEIRGGYFVGGISGEQFALPEAIGLLRSIRKAPPNRELITLSAADPLNLQGILTPGPRIASLTTNRILFRDGFPLAALEARKIRKLAAGRVRVAAATELADDSVSDLQIETALKVGKLRASLRPYYK